MKSSAEHFFPGTSKSGESIKYCAFSSPNDTKKKSFLQIIQVNNCQKAWTTRPNFLTLAKLPEPGGCSCCRRLWLWNRGDWGCGGKGQKKQPLLHPLSFTWNLVHCRFYFKDKKPYAQLTLAKYHLLISNKDLIHFHLQNTLSLVYMHHFQRREWEMRDF